MSAIEEQALGFDLDDAFALTRPRVLVIDDDDAYLDLMKIMLRKAGFDVASASDHQTALDKCKEIKPHVILLDLMMPEVDGWELYHLLRGVSDAPIIMVTASANRENAVRSLGMGVADYISKPFYNPEVVARIKKVLQDANREAIASEKVFPDIHLRINYMTRQVWIRGREVRLQPREYDLLLALVAEAPRSVSYRALTERLWGQDTPKNRNHLKAVVFALRQNLEDDPAAPTLIVNYRGLGYQLIISAKE